MRFQRGDDFVGRGHRHAQPPHHHARRGAGQLGRAAHAQAGDQAEREHGDDRVAGAR